MANKTQSEFRLPQQSIVDATSKYARSWPNWQAKRGSNHMDIKTQTRVRPETSPMYWVPRYQEWLTLSQIEYRKQQEV